jgi:hypothetical protein
MLSNQAVLVRLSVSQWTGYKFDKKATEEVEANHGANNHAGEVGRFNKQLASKKYMKDLSSNITNARTYHYDQTLPWQDAEGVRILPVKNYQNYQQQMSEYRSKHEQALDKFVQAYPDLINEAKYRLNGLFNSEDFPLLSDIRSKFAWSISFSPLPETGDFRVSLSQEVVQQMELDLEKRLASNYTEACRDLFDRVYKQASHMADRLANYNGTRSGRFNDSLVDNARELAELLPRLNVGGDARLDALARDIDQKLCQYSAQILRENDAARAEVTVDAKAIAQQTEDILKQMSAMFA